MRGAVGMGMLGLSVLFAGGCAGRPLGLAQPCSYSFAQPMASDGQATCYLGHDGELTLQLWTAIGQVSLAVQSSATEGTARLESAATIRHQPGEVYGLTDLTVESDGAEPCSDWGGHVAWKIDHGHWSFDLIATGCRQYWSDPRFNGTITSS